MSPKNLSIEICQKWKKKKGSYILIMLFPYTLDNNYQNDEMW